MFETTTPPIQSRSRSIPTALLSLDAHLLDDLWGVTPDQRAVAQGLSEERDGVTALARMSALRWCRFRRG